jgi:hypothetical protein
MYSYLEVYRNELYTVYVYVYLCGKKNDFDKTPFYYIES